MPGIPILYDPENKDINRLADEERKARIQTINVGWQYYDGDHRKPLKVNPDETDDNIIVNLIGGSIDKTTEAMGVPELSVEGGIDNVVADGAVTAEVSPEQELIEKLVEASDFEMLLPDTLTTGAVEGHNFWRIVVDPNRDGEGVISEDNLPYLMPIDSRFMTVFWYQMNPSKTLFYRIEWKFGNSAYRQDIVPGWLLSEDSNFGIPVEPDEWVVLEFVKETNQQKFVFSGGDVWHYPFPPIIEWKNRRKPKSFYGDSDLKNAGLNDALNFVMSNTSRIIKHHAHPKTIGKGMDASDVIETAINGFFTVENDNADVFNLEMQSDLQSSMVFIELLRNNFYSMQRVVDVSGIKDRLGQISNFGVRMLFDDMIKMLEDKQSRYGEAINEAFKRMLYMMGVEVEGINIEWADPLPVDMRELVEIAEKEKNLGITSDQTIAKQLNRDYVKEQAQRQEEQDIATDERVNTIVRLAQAGVNGN